MSLKSRIGPLALEAPLGSRSGAGQLFRAIHVEQRKLLAVRVFPTPLGLTPESRAEYAAQLEELKQLRHSSIVRCYGGGFDARNAYLVYELIDGESLDSVLARRHRLPWDTALAYGQQLADALQYAHLMGWVHGRIRPDKILVPNDGSPVKLNDFRRTAIASMIGGGTQRVEDYLYAAPEQLDPNQVATEKCDLYALGAVMYTMLVGAPPLRADSLYELHALHQNTTPPTVQSQVLDCPVWLSAVVEQLLDKDPQRRPFGAAAVQLAFKEAERRESQGVGVLQHATAGFSPLRLNADREEAERVLGIQPAKPRRPRSELPPWETVSFLVVALMVCVGVVVWFSLPLGKASLRARAEALLASQEYDDWDEAREIYLNALIERFPDSDEASWAREQVDWVDAATAERRLERMARKNLTPEREIDRRFIEAWRYEQFGDRATALDRYRGIVKLLADDQVDRPVVLLSQRKIRDLEARPPEAYELRRLLASKLVEADKAFSSGRVATAKETWESIVNLYGSNQEMAEPVAIARTRLDRLK